jgi:arylsulfatase A-like enzyme
MLGLAHRGFGFDDYDKHIVNLLRERGFETLLCGVQHEGCDCFHPEEGAGIIGYDRNLSEAFGGDPEDGDRTAEWDLANAEKAASWLTTSQTHREKPFFLSCGFYSTHRAYPSLNSVNPDHVRPPHQIYNDRENRIDHARFLESMTVFDRCFEKVLKALDEGPHGEDTLVLLTTDHGLALPYTKCHLNEAGMGVSLSIRVPGRTEGGVYTDALVSHVDVLPTLFELLDLDLPEGIQGRSFASLFDHPEGDHREYVFGEVNFHTSYEPMRSVRSSRFNYIRHFAPDERMIHLSNIDDSSAKALLMEYGLGERIKPACELYDLISDPMEKNNLAEDPSYKGVLDRMDGLLREWQKETDDPLLQGELELKPGYIVNTADCIVPDSPVPDDYLQR